MRTQARALLEDARTEVAVLAKRRDEIAAELSGLSGVISALAVPPDPQHDARPTPSESDAQHDTTDTEEPR